MTLGIDIGTTSVSGVAVDSGGKVAATVTQAHEADIPGLPPGVHAQDPARLMSAVDRVIAALEAQAGAADRIGWTGQMHGVVGVDRALSPVTPFVTWRDARRFGGRVMAAWAAEGRAIAACLPICGLAIARRTGRRWAEALRVPAEEDRFAPEPERFAPLPLREAGFFAEDAVFFLSEDAIASIILYVKK